MQKIALVGLKGIGKDHFFTKFNEKHISKRYAIGDILKVESFGIYHDWECSNYLYEDFIFLKDSINSNNQEIISLLKPIHIEYINSIENFDSLDNVRKLKLIEITKNISLCKSRYSMNSFGTFVRQKTGNNSYFLDKLFDKINEDIDINGYLFVNDSRYVTELLDFLLNDFYIIKLENDTHYKYLTEKWGDLHPTEIELGCYPKSIGLTVNMKGTLEVGIIKRRTPEEMFEIVDEVYTKIQTFNGYNQSHKLMLKEIKNQLVNDNQYKKALADYVYGLDNKGSDFENIKKIYCDICWNYVDKIENIINIYY